MFDKSARYYDLIYESMGKDYAKEAGTLREWISRYRQTEGNRLLDIACGTGGHLRHLRDSFACEGVDLEPGLLERARESCPGVPFHRGDMAEFELGCQFDVVLCLFGSIGYTRSVERLRVALANFARHTTPGGLVLIEPWFSPSAWNAGRIHATLVDRPEVKIARLARSTAEGSLSIIEFQYLVATVEGVEHLAERHEMGLFTDEEYRAAFSAAALEMVYEGDGLWGRRMLIGRRRATA